MITLCSSQLRRVAMDDHDPSRITDLSTKTVVFLIVFVPGIILVVLIWMSYAFGSWT